jgi:hypothetical protein
MIRWLRPVVVVWTPLMVALGIVWYALSWDAIDSFFGVLGAALCAVVVGGILTVRVPRNAVGPLALTAGSAEVLYLFGNAYATASLQSGGSGLRRISWAGSAHGWVRCSWSDSAP